MNRRTKALQIPPRVKRIVHERDGGRCILCGAQGDPVAHYISRAQGGLGIEENVVTLCAGCHRAYDQGPYRRTIRAQLRAYLEGQYPGWDENNLIYRKEG